MNTSRCLWYLISAACILSLGSAAAWADDDVVEKLVAQWKQQRGEIESLKITSEKLTQPCPGVPQETVTTLVKELLNVLNAKDPAEATSRKAAHGFMEALLKKRIDPWSNYEILTSGLKLRNTSYDAAGKRVRESANSNAVSVQYHGANNQYDISEHPRVYQYGKDFVRYIPPRFPASSWIIDASDDGTYTLLKGDPMEFMRARVRKEDGLAEFISRSDREWIIQGHFEKFSGVSIPRFTCQISFRDGKAESVSCHWVTAAEVNLKLTEEDFHIPLTSGGLINDYRDTQEGERPHQFKFKSPFDAANVLDIANEQRARRLEGR